MELYDALKALNTSQLAEVMLRARVDDAMVRGETRGLAAVDLAQMAEGDEALRERLWAAVRAIRAGRSGDEPAPRDPPGVDPPAVRPGAGCFDVFLSHASEDKEAVRAFVRQLRAAGVASWLDEEQMGPGVDPKVAIPAGIDASRHVVIWLTGRWLAKDWTQWELGLFKEVQQGGRRVIPVLHVPWDNRAFGPYLVQQIAVPQEIADADERLWLVVCGIRGTAPGPREDWQQRGRDLVRQATAPRPPPRRVAVAVVGVAEELEAAMEGVEQDVRGRAQVSGVVRVAPDADDAGAVLASCEVIVLLVGAAVGGDRGFAQIGALLGDARTIAALRYPPPLEAMARFGAQMGWSGQLVTRIERTFAGDDAAGAVRGEVAAALERLVPADPGSSGAPTPWEEAYLRQQLSSQWLQGHHAALIERARRRTLQRATLYVSLHADPGTVGRDGEDRPVLADPRARPEPEEGLRRKRAPVTLDEALCLPGLRRCLVVGDAGTGKTVLVQHIAATLALYHLRGGIDEGWAGCVEAVRAAARLDLAALGEGAPLVPIPVAFEARVLHRALGEGEHGALLRLLCERLGGGVAEVEAGLSAGRYWVLVDSLDEVPTVAGRKRVLRALAAVAEQRGRLLITSRPGAHTAVDVPPVFRMLPIAPLDDGLREQLIARWSAGQGYGEAERTALTEAVGDLRGRFVSDSNDRPIEDNPLLLTCTFLVFQDQRRLPDNTADLYKRMLDILCETRGTSHSEADALPAVPADPDEARRVSGQLRLGRARALAMALQTRRVTVAPRRALAQALVVDRTLGLRDLDEAEAMVSELAASTGIFREVEEEGVVVRPWHRSFQEYLAASHLAKQDDTVKALIDGLVDTGRVADAGWRGALSFLIGALGQVEAGRAQSAVERMVVRAEGAEALVAGRLYALAAAGASEYRQESFTGQEALLAGLARAALDRFGRDGASWDWRDRVGLLDALGALGLDDRFPDPGEDAGGWVKLDAWEGEVGEGDRDERWGAMARRQVKVGALWVLNRPVTVRDYAPFVQGGGPAPPLWRSQQRTPSRPVWGVTWEQAVAFCQWATAAWADALPERGTVDLLTSVEWESIARRDGGGRWPWGDQPEPDDTSASFAWGGESPRHLTPVGAFPAGNVRRGGGVLYDLAGNVWEWTRTRSEEDGSETDVATTTPRVAKATPDEVPRVVRGGAWYDPSRYLRCSVRDGCLPWSRGDYLGFRVSLRPDLLV